MEQKGCLYCSCGCIAFVGLVIAAVVGAGFLGFTFVEGFVTDMKDPEARGEQARSILGTERLPDGYRAQMIFRIPWGVLDAVILTDAPPESAAATDGESFGSLTSESLGEHVFFYFAVRGDDQDEEEIEAIFEGRGRPNGVNVDLGSNFESGELLTQGGFPLDPGELSYRAHRGRIVTEDRERIDGVYSLMKIDCPGGGRLRIAAWFARADEDSTDLAGTPADEAALQELMNQFALCAL